MNTNEKCAGLMGWKFTSDRAAPHLKYWEAVNGKRYGKFYEVFPDFQNDIAAAWMLVEFMDSKEINVQIDPNVYDISRDEDGCLVSYRGHIYENRNIYGGAFGLTAPEAICAAMNCYI